MILEATQKVPVCAEPYLSGADLSLTQHLCFAAGQAESDGSDHDKPAETAAILGSGGRGRVYTPDEEDKGANGPEDENGPAARLEELHGNSLAPEATVRTALWDLQDELDESDEEVRCVNTMFQRCVRASLFPVTTIIACCRIFWKTWRWMRMLTPARRS